MKETLEERVARLERWVLWFDPFLAYEISKEKNMVAKSKKVSKGVKKSKTKSPTIKTRTGMRGGSVSGAYRECGVCHKTGHNARSHEPGAKLALPPAKRR